MLQTLVHIPLEIAGIPVFGFGLLLAVWVLFSVGSLVWLGRRQGFSADTWGYLPLLVLVGAIIWWLLPAICNEQGFPIRGYGVMTLVAVVAGTALAIWRARRVGLDADLILSLAFWMLVPGILGARVFYVIEYWSDQYWPIYQQNGFAAILVAVINIAEGGQVAYGAFLGAVPALLLFIRKYRLPLLATCDLIAPSIMLGLALGRIGCVFTGCCYGSLCEYPWKVTFPANAPPYVAQVERGLMHGFELSGDSEAAPVLRSVDPQSPAGQAGLQAGDRLQSLNGYEVKSAGQVHRILWKLFSEKTPLVLQTDNRSPVTLPAIPIPPRSRPVHPTQVYSAVNALLLCLLLLAYGPFRRRDGELLALMISVYPIARFLLEMIRTDESPVFGTGMSISQNLSLMLLVCAAGLWFYLLRRPYGKAFG